MNKTEIDNLFKTGKKSYGKILKVISVAGNGEVIISAPIKTFKRAVDRNRVKRLIREAIREVDFSNKIESDNHDRLVSLVEQMMSLYNRLKAVNSPNEKKVIQKQIVFNY